MNSTDSQEPLTFEQAFRALETMVTKFENGQLGLDESLALFREATDLLAFCRQKLNSAEQQVNQLLAKLEEPAVPANDSGRGPEPA